MLPSDGSYVSLRLTLGGLFLYAGVAKILSPATFYAAVQSVAWLPDWFLTLVAFTLPPLEILGGTGLLLNYQTRSCTFIMAGLTPIFIAFHLLHPGGCGYWG